MELKELLRKIADGNFNQAEIIQAAKEHYNKCVESSISFYVDNGYAKITIIRSGFKGRFMLIYEDAGDSYDIKYIYSIDELEKFLAKENIGVLLSWYL